MKRAIVLGGGGPVCGLQIGALRALAEHGLLDTFHVWSLSCIGAWVGIRYNTLEGTPQARVMQSYEFFRKVFKDDRVHDGFPSPSVFAPDFRGNAISMLEFVTDPKVLRSMVVPDAMQAAVFDTLRFCTDRERWTEGDANMLLLHLMSVNPFVRLMTSAIYRTRSNGLARMRYPDSKFMREMHFERLARPDQPIIYHNAHNLTKARLEHFSNRSKLYPEITCDTLCACSALPMVLGTVKLNGDDYCEGAMDRPLDFDSLQHHTDVTEVWSVPILDVSQVRHPQDLTHAMANLPMMAAAAHGKTLTDEYKRDHPEVKFIEIKPAADITYDWSHGNFETCCNAGYGAAQMAITRYLADLDTKPSAARPPQSEAW